MGIGRKKGAKDKKPRIRKSGYKVGSYKNMREKPYTVLETPQVNPNIEIFYKTRFKLEEYFGISKEGIGLI